MFGWTGEVPKSSAFEELGTHDQDVLYQIISTGDYNVNFV